MDLGDPRVDANIAACEQGLRRLLHTERADVFFYAANGHGVWEAVVENLAGAGPGGADRRHRALLRVVGGADRGAWAGAWCARRGAKAGRSMPTAVEQALREDSAHEIRAVFAVHTDTASGVTSDIAAMRRALDAARHPALLVADVVASLGAAPFAMDELGVDVVGRRVAKRADVPAGRGLRRGQRQSLCRGREKPCAALLLGLGAPQGRDCRIASSAARRRRTCCSGSRQRWS